MTLRCGLCLFGSLLFLPQLAQAADDGDDLHLTVAPYLWAPVIKGTVTAGPLSLPIQVHPSQLASGLRSGLMGYATADYRGAFVTTEFIAVNFKRADFQPTLGQDVRVKILSMEAEAGVKLPVGRSITLSPFSGLRYNDLSVDLGTPPANLRVSGNWTEPLLGMNAAVTITHRLSATAKIAQGLGGDARKSFDTRIDLNYHLSRRVSLFAGYRRLDQKYRQQQSAPFRLDLRGKGPMIGLRLSATARP